MRLNTPLPVTTRSSWFLFLLPRFLSSSPSANTERDPNPQLKEYSIPREVDKMRFLSSFLPVLSVLALSAWARALPSAQQASNPNDRALGTLPPSAKDVRAVTIYDSTWGLRNVSYYTTPDGLAIIEGDIIYGTEADLLAAAHAAANLASDQHIQKARGPGAFFPNATIRFAYESAETEKILKERVTYAIANWRHMAPYLIFEELPIGTAKHEKHVVEFRHGPGCVAHVGYGDWPGINLGPGCGDRQTAHEIGHVLGMVHEHTRADRDEWVRFRCENVNPACPNMPAGRTCCDTLFPTPGGLPEGCCLGKGNFNKLKDWEGDPAITGDYDISSIMHYDEYGFGFGGKKVLEMVKYSKGRKGFQDQNDFPTHEDANRICNMYKEACQAWSTWHRGS
jgi:hypothetical protein